MRYWHNEVEKTALGPSVHRVYHFTGTDPINKVLHWHWRTAEIEPMKEVLLLFYLLDQFTSPYYFKTKANFWLRCCGSTCETTHSNHWCYKTCQSFSNSFFLCRDLIFFYSTAQHAICFSTTIEVVLTVNEEFKQLIYTVMVALDTFLFPCINRVTICHWNVIILINIQLHIP